MSPVDAALLRLVELTQRALQADQKGAPFSNHAGDIGAAIERVVHEAGYGTADDLARHCLGITSHGEPQVPNLRTPRRGSELLPGLTIAIEPMMRVVGSATPTLRNRWTVVTTDGSRSAHVEHTVAVTDAGPLVRTRAA